MSSSLLSDFKNKRMVFISSLVLTSLVSISCSNIFKGMSDQESQEAYLEDAIKYNNAKQYDSAIDIIENKLTTDTKNSDDMRRFMASVYAGKCGLDFIQYFNNLSSASDSDSEGLKFLMTAWNGKTVSATHCKTAETIMKQIAPTFTTRTASDSFFMVILAMAKIGTYLKTIVDADDNGEVDTTPTDFTQADGFCLSANISNESVAELASGLGIILSNIANVGNALSDSTFDLSSISSTCNSLPSPNPCLIEDQNEFLNNSTARLAIRTLFNAPSSGLNPNGTLCLSE